MAEIALPGGSMAVFVANGAAAGPTGPEESAVAAPRRTVIVLHDGSGLDEAVRETSRRLASRGFVAIAPEVIYPAEPTLGASRDALASQVAATLAFARSPGGLSAGGVAILGLGLGGFGAFLGACRSDLTVAVVVYGSGIARIRRSIDSELDSWARSVAPVRCVVGAEDGSVDVRDVAAMESRLAVYRVPHDVVVYPRAGDRFMSEGTPKYRAAAATDAWERILGWLSVAKRSRRQRRSFRL